MALQFTSTAYMLSTHSMLSTPSMLSTSSKVSADIASAALQLQEGMVQKASMGSKSQTALKPTSTMLTWQMDFRLQAPQQMGVR